MSPTSTDRESIAAACLFLVTFLIVLTAVSTGSAPAWAKASESGIDPSSQDRETIPTIQPTIPAEDDGEPLEEALQIDLHGAPSPFCPGHTLYYTLVMTNVRQGPMHNLLISYTLPNHTCCPQNGPATTIPFSETLNTLLWYTDTVAVSQTVTVELMLHSFASIVNGSTVTSTFFIDSDEIAAGEVAVGVTANDAVCEPTATPTHTPTHTPTATPTPTCTPTPTPTQLENLLYLPLIFQ